MSIYTLELFTPLEQCIYTHTEFSSETHRIGVSIFVAVLHKKR